VSDSPPTDQPPPLEPERKPEFKLEPPAPGEHRIELEKTAPIDIPRYIVHDAPTDGGTPPPEYPVPAAPLHLCPNCDYNLTGLTSRRCPECGEPFTIPDARIHASDQSPAMRRFYRVVWLDRAGGIVGVVLIAAAFIVPHAVSGGCANWPALQITGRGLLASYFIFPLVLALLLGNLQFEVRWSRVFFVTGLLSAIAAVLVCCC